MNKLLTLTILLSACSRDVAPNKAEIIALSQAPDAKCDTAVTAKRKIAIAVCVIDKKEFVTIYSSEYPFQVFGIESVTTRKEREARTTPPAPAVPPAPAPAVPAPAPAPAK
jgi:hypothetical protein